MSWEEALQAERAEKLLEEALGARRIDCPMSAGDVVLECGKVLHFDIARPRKKELLWCRNHEKYEPVVKVADGKSFRVRCETCAYTRGKDGELGAERGAAAHRAKRPMHTVHLLDSTGTVVRTFKPDTTDTLVPDLPPY
jgi:hypothetical protein